MTKIELDHDVRISITHYSNKFGNEGKGHIEPFLSELYSLLQTPKVVGHDEENKLMNGLITSGKVTGQRSNNNVKHKNILVYDVDDLPDGVNLFDEVSGLYSGAFAIYSTYKHQQPEVKGTSRYRLLMPVNRNLTPLQYTNLMDMVAKQLDLQGVDGSSYTLSQPFALPTVKEEGSPYEFRYQDAPPMNLSDELVKKLSHNSRKIKLDIGDSELYKKKSVEEWERYIKPLDKHEGRNIAMTKILGHLLAKNVEPLIIYTLMEHWNAGHITPMDDKRFNRTFVSIYERHKRNRGEAY